MMFISNSKALVQQTSLLEFSEIETLFLQERLQKPVPEHRHNTTQGPSWGYSKVNFERFFRKRGRFSPNVDQNEEMAPRTRTGYPHEGPFVG
jgi:hypothetical protein